MTTTLRPTPLGSGPPSSQRRVRAGRPARGVLGVRVAIRAPRAELAALFARAFEDVPGPAELVEFDLDDVDDLAVPLTAVVFDADVDDHAAVAEACRMPRFATVPKVVVGRIDRAEALATAIPADDTLHRPVLDCRWTARRFRTVVELGRERILRSLLEQSFDGGVTGLTLVDTSDDEAPLVHASRSFERITGYSLDESIGKNCRFLRADGADDGVLRAQIRYAVARRKPTTVLLKNMRKDGTRFWNELSIFPIKIQGEYIPIVGGIQHDVTELVDARAENEMLTSQLIDRRAFDDAVLDAVDVGIVATDADGRIVYANRAAAELVGVTTTQLLGEYVASALKVDFVKGGRAAHRAIREVRYTEGETGPRDVELQIYEGCLPSKGSLGSLFVLRDTTREHRLHEEMRRVERLAALGTMVAGFAHEIRNPVASLRALAEALADELADRGMDLPHPARMLGVLSRVERLVTSSLELGRRASPRPAEHAVAALVANVVAAVEPRTRTLVRIDVDVDADLPPVFVDEQQITQILVVLLDNAIDAARGGGVRIRARAVRTGIRFDVEDDGPGIAPDDVRRVFDPFFTTKAHGTGLGLSIASALATENGARLELASPKGPTTFALTCATRLPVVLAARAG